MGPHFLSAVLAGADDIQTEFRGRRHHRVRSGFTGRGELSPEHGLFSFFREKRSASYEEVDRYGNDSDAGGMV